MGAFVRVAGPRGAILRSLSQPLLRRGYVLRVSTLSRPLPKEKIRPQEDVTITSRVSSSRFRRIGGGFATVHETFPATARGAAGQQAAYHRTQTYGMSRYLWSRSNNSAKPPRKAPLPNSMDRKLITDARNSVTADGPRLHTAHGESRAGRQQNALAPNLSRAR